MQITFSFVVAIVCFPLVARAEIIQAPFGGQPIGLGDARVACGTPGGGWIVERSGHAVRPPASDDEIGEAVELKLATDVAACASTRAVITLVTTGRWPVFDPASVVFAADEGRFDARGRQLRGVAIALQGPGGIVSDVCPDPRLEANAEHCTWAVGPGLASDPGGVAFTW